MRIVFFGSGEFGLPALAHLHANHDLVAVISQPDRPAGRRRSVTPTGVARWAQTAGVTLVRCPNVNDMALICQVAAYRADAAVVIAFGQKLGPALLEVLGPWAINLHGSLLPQYRGAAPIAWAMIRGEHETGLSVISLAVRMDAGLIYGQQRIAIDPDWTAGELHGRLAAMGPALIEQMLVRIIAGTLEGHQQDETQVTRAPKLSKRDGQVNFTLDAVTVRCRIHGLTPWPGVRVRWQRRRDGREQHLIVQRVKDDPHLAHNEPPGTVLPDCRVAVGTGAVQLLQVQLPGRRPMPMAAFAHGHQLAAGDLLLGPSAGD